MDSLESLRRKITSADELKSVVRTMKALAAANIGQYEAAVNSLQDYYNTVELGIISCLFKNKTIISHNKKTGSKPACALLAGSDLGLVGKFNDSLVEYFLKISQSIDRDLVIWTVGDRIGPALNESDLNTDKIYTAPSSVQAVTPLVASILADIATELDNNRFSEFYVFYHKPNHGIGYTPTHQRILPIDQTWQLNFSEKKWPTQKVPQVIGDTEKVLKNFIDEYLFVSLFKALTESLTSENASRLAAMQRAEKNIEELLDNLGHEFHSLRQSSIDEELFDIISGFESIINKKKAQ